MALSGQCEMYQMTYSGLEIRGHTQTHVSLVHKQNIYRGYSRGQFNLTYLSFSTQVIMEFQLLLKHKKTLKIKTFSCFQTLRCCIYHASKC